MKSSASEPGLTDLHGPSLAQQITCNCDKILFYHTQRWYQVLFFISFFFVLMLCYLFCYYKSVYKNYFITIIIILILLFFHKNYFSFFMFRNVPACSGMFRVPGFIDAHQIQGNWGDRNFVTESRVNWRLITHTKMHRRIWSLQLPTDSTFE